MERVDSFLKEKKLFDASMDVDEDETNLLRTALRMRERILQCDRQSIQQQFIALKRGVREMSKTLTPPQAASALERLRLLQLAYRELDAKYKNTSLFVQPRYVDVHASAQNENGAF
jgi:hypothetical protein